MDTERLKESCCIHLSPDDIRLPYQRLGLMTWLLFIAGCVFGFGLTRNFESLPDGGARPPGPFTSPANLIVHSESCLASRDSSDANDARSPRVRGASNFVILFRTYSSEGRRKNTFSR